MSIRKLTSILITALILFGVSSAFGEDYKTKLTLTLKSGSAIANPTYDVSYTLTVPESLTISNTGWNAIGSMTVAYSGTGDNVGFSTDKKLVVTASSTNDFKLVANGGSSSISYFLATSESGTKTTTFEFTAAQITAGASQTLGVNVEDFTSKANGTYTDEITYTVAIQDAGTTASVSDMLTNGAVTVVSATVNGISSVSGTFTYNGSEFTASNVSGAGSAIAFVNDSNVQFDFKIGNNTYTVLIYPNDKTYVNGASTALTSVTVNGTEVFSTLTLLESKI